MLPVLCTRKDIRLPKWLRIILFMDRYKKRGNAFKANEFPLLYGLKQDYLGGLLGAVLLLLLLLLLLRPLEPDELLEEEGV